MSKDSEVYERLVQEVYQTMLQVEGLADVVVMHDVKLKGRSGQPHQIDVYWEFSRGGERYRTVVECKLHKRAIQLDAVTKLAYILDDLGPGTTGIVVSWSGFQSGAETTAKDSRIKLLEMHLILRHLQIDIELVSPPTIGAVQMKFDQESALAALDAAGGGETEIEMSVTDVDTVFVVSGERKSLRTLLGDRRGEVGTHSVDCAGLTVDTKFGPVGVRELRVRIDDGGPPMNQTMNVDTGEAARVIVRNVLEGHSFYVNDDGTIIKAEHE